MQLQHNHLINTSFDVAPTALSVATGSMMPAPETNSSAETCVPGQSPVCSTHEFGASTETTGYTMSDGSEWTETVTYKTYTETRTDGVTTGYKDSEGNTIASLDELESTTVWTDGNGDVVEEPSIIN